MWGRHLACPLSLYFPSSKQKIPSFSIFSCGVGRTASPKKIPHLTAGDFNYSPTKLVAGSTELPSSGGNQERRVGDDVANSEVS
ncbi:hypothetical protein Cylst_1751 [Cylindrospermum stagnale PCC 7417]|uniref:Uncharacterized protein n=1 Tax=Cylindrospermum stagnale PCC 7417 TaxID=56107 RepID=K9WWY5_9NOST|nr:hypothetical protein Cylst_1751 [Cylindrospermum stagnale PCC 7417]